MWRWGGWLCREFSGWVVWVGWGGWGCGVGGQVLLCVGGRCMGREAEVGVGGGCGLGVGCISRLCVGKVGEGVYW